MAKPLFNSPRYDKKEKESEYKGCFLYFFYVLIIIASACLGTYIKSVSPESGDAALLFFTILGIALPPSIYLMCQTNKSPYKQYVKRINSQKELFHSGGKPVFIVRESATQNLNELYLNLSLRLLAAVMKADKEEQVVEMDIVRSFIYRTRNKYNIYTQKTDEFKSYLKEDFSVEDVAFTMYWWFEASNEEIYDPDTGRYYKLEDKRQTLLFKMFELAYADGYFCEAEEYTIRYIAYHMRLTENDYEKTLIEFINWQYSYEKDEIRQEAYEKYRKARYKRDGGYWYRDRYGNKKWKAIPKDEDEETEENTNQSENQDNAKPHIPSEIEKAFAVLGIPVDATPSEINACKRNLMRRNHPDLVAYQGQEAVYAATIKCQEINQAYELLKANGKC